MTVYTKPDRQLEWGCEARRKGESWLYLQQLAFPGQSAAAAALGAIRRSTEECRQKNWRGIRGGHSPLTFESDRTLRESSGGRRGELVRLAVRETTGVGSYTVCGVSSPSVVLHVADK